MTPTEHAELLRELAAAIHHHVDHRNPDAALKFRARAAAEEIEGRKTPSEEQILACRSWSSHGPTMDSDLVEFGYTVLARFGAAAAEIEGRRKMTTPKQLKVLSDAIGGAECADNHHDPLGVALATYFEESRYRPDNDPPCDEDGLDSWTEWVIAKTNEMLLDAARIALARFGGGEVES